MASGLDARPVATTYDVARIVELVQKGQVRVPSFQRDFRWGREDVKRLFDSIIKGYPIGSLLLWVRPAPEMDIAVGRLRLHAPALDKALWVVDGQQRITSLANVLLPVGQHDERFSLCYDLRDHEIVSAASGARSWVIPFHVLFDLQKMLQWFAKRPELGDFLDHATWLVSTIRQYPVPANQVEQGDLRVLQDIFDRLNNSGKRLKRSEVFAALNDVGDAAREGALTFELIAEHIDVDRAFGVVDADTVLKAILARRGVDVFREIRNEFGREGDEGRDVAFAAGEQALLRAVGFLQEEAGVPHIALLCHRYLLVVLARFFALHPEPDQRNRRLLRRWFWRAAVAGPGHFRGGATGAIRALCSKIEADDVTRSVQELLRAVGRGVVVLPDSRRFRTNEAATKILLCSWWDAGPYNPETRKPYSHFDLWNCIEERQTAGDAVRYIIPRVASNRVGAANRVLMPQLENDDEAGGVLLLTVEAEDDPAWSRVLRSHLITAEMVDLFRKTDFDEFMLRRGLAITGHLERFLERMCEWGLEDTPPLSALVLEDESSDDVD